MDGEGKGEKVREREREKLKDYLIPAIVHCSLLVQLV